MPRLKTSKTRKVLRDSRDWQVGGTPAMELYLMYGAARRLIEARGVRVIRSLVGNHVASLEMAGCSITVNRLDDGMADLWDASVRTPALRWCL